MEVILGLSPFVVVHPAWLGHSPRGRSFFCVTLFPLFHFHFILYFSLVIFLQQFSEQALKERVTKLWDR